MKINNPDLFVTLEALEGLRWAETDRQGGEHSLTKLIAVWAEYKTHKEEWELGGFNTETAQLLGHSGVVYGEGGWARYLIRGEEIVLDGSSTHNDKKEKALSLGIRVLS